MEYPDQFLKGIPNKQFLTEDNLPTAGLIFDKKRDDQGRQDGNLESSINWHDGNDAIDLLLNQERGGRHQFQEGIVKMCRKELDLTAKKAVCINRLFYERAKQPDNPYHGNLLVEKSLKPATIKMIASLVAGNCFLEHIPNPFCRKTVEKG